MNFYQSYESVEVDERKKANFIIHNMIIFNMYFRGSYIFWLSQSFGLLSCLHCCVSQVSVLVVSSQTVRLNLYKY